MIVFAKGDTVEEVCLMNCSSVTGKQSCPWCGREGEKNDDSKYMPTFLHAFGSHLQGVDLLGTVGI